MKPARALLEPQHWTGPLSAAAVSLLLDEGQVERIPRILADGNASTLAFDRPGHLITYEGTLPTVLGAFFLPWTPGGKSDGLFCSVRRHESGAGYLTLLSALPTRRPEAPSLFWFEVVLEREAALAAVLEFLPLGWRFLRSGALPDNHEAWRPQVGTLARSPEGMLRRPLAEVQAEHADELEIP